MELTEYTKIISDLAATVREAIKSELSKASYDKTFKGKVVENPSTGKYVVLYKNKKYTLSYSGTLSIGQTVRVCAPQNNWNDLFIIG